MENARLAPLVGIAAAVGVLAVLVAPFLVVQPSSAIGTYYGTGAITPYITGLFALLSVVVFAAGREDRTDPAMAAGATLVMGVFALVVAALWALTVPIEVVTGMGTATVMEYHRFALVVVALAMPVAAAWYARALRLL